MEKDTDTIATVDTAAASIAVMQQQPYYDVASTTDYYRY